MSTIDADAMLARYAPGTLIEFGTIEYAVQAARDIKALLAELDRLRQSHADLSDMYADQGRALHASEAWAKDAEALIQRHLVRYFSDNDVEALLARRGAK